MAPESITPERLSKRARAILYAVVTEFLSSGEPVGSRTLARKYGLDLSPATIRNVLADLEDIGLLAQPHTSAGRVPTESAFRLFIDALMRVQSLNPDDASRISELAELPRGADLLRASGKLLSDITGVAAVLLRSRSEHRTVTKLRFIATRPGELLTVIVLSDGTVENRFIHVDQSVSESLLDRLHNLLEEVVEGRTLSAVHEYFKVGLEQRRDELRALHALGQSLTEAFEQGESAEVIIEGQAKLLERPELTTAEHVRDLVLALQDRQHLVELLGSTLEAKRVQVFLGDEMARIVGYPVSLVAAPYRGEDGQPGGALGVLGPARMDYPFVVPLVGATAQAMSEAMSRSRGPENHEDED